MRLCGSARCTTDVEDVTFERASSKLCDDCNATRRGGKKRRRVVEDGDEDFVVMVKAPDRDIWSQDALTEFEKLTVSAQVRAGNHAPLVASSTNGLPHHLS